MASLLLLFFCILFLPELPVFRRVYARYYFSFSQLNYIIHIRLIAATRWRLHVASSLRHHCPPSRWP